MPLPASIEAREYRQSTAGRPTSGEAGDGDAVPEAWDDDEVATTALDPIRLVAGPEADGGRLDKWLAARLPSYSRSRLQRWIADGGVQIAGRVAATRDAVWKGDEVVVVPQPGEQENAFVAEDVPLDIVHEDDAVLVIDKRAGLVVHPASGNWHGTVLNGLLRHAPALAGVPRAGIVHRLDKDTTGLMVVAKTIEAQTDLVRQLQARSVGRRYVAVVYGTAPARGRVDRPIGRDPRDRLRMKAFDPGETGPGAKPAATRFETLATAALEGGRTVSLVVCRLESGRTHQIRVHLQSIGHPLVGDATYGGSERHVAFGRQALHAWHLRLVHPATGGTAAWSAALPDDLEELVRRCGLDADVLSSVSTDDAA